MKISQDSLDQVADSDDIPDEPDLSEIKYSPEELELMHKRKTLLRSRQRKLIKRPSVNTRISGNGTMSSYSITPLPRDFKITPKKSSENGLESVFWRKNNRNQTTEPGMKEDNQDMDKSVQVESKKDIE